MKLVFWLTEDSSRHILKSCSRSGSLGVSIIFHCCNCVSGPFLMVYALVPCSLLTILVFSPWLPVSTPVPALADTLSLTLGSWFLPLAHCLDLVFGFWHQLWHLAPDSWLSALADSLDLVTWQVLIQALTTKLSDFFTNLPTARSLIKSDCKNGMVKVSVSSLSMIPDQICSVYNIKLFF